MLTRKYKNSNFIPENDTLYLVDTSQSPVVITLPSNIPNGFLCGFVDIKGTNINNPTGFSKNTCRINVGTQEHLICGASFLILEEMQSITIVFYENRWVLVSLSR